MVSILNNQTSNEEFLEFATNEVHNVDVATTHHGAPSAQVCDLVLNKNGKLYIVTSSQNPYFQDLIHQPKVIINGYKGDGTMDYVAFRFGEQLKMSNMNILTRFLKKMII